MERDPRPVSPCEPPLRGRGSPRSLAQVLWGPPRLLAAWVSTGLAAVPSGWGNRCRPLLACPLLLPLAWSCSHGPGLGVPPLRNVTAQSHLDLKVWSCHTLRNELLGTASVSLWNLLKSGGKCTSSPKPPPRGVLSVPLRGRGPPMLRVPPAAPLPRGAWSHKGMWHPWVLGVLVASPLQLLGDPNPSAPCCHVQTAGGGRGSPQIKAPQSAPSSRVPCS